VVLDQVAVAFDDRRSVANAGLLLPATLAERLGIEQVTDQVVDLGDRPGRARPGRKLLTLVHVMGPGRGRRHGRLASRRVVAAGAEVQVRPAALRLHLIDFAFAILRAAGLERQQLRVHGSDRSAVTMCRSAMHSA
jgi:hypothetical protein